MIENEEKSYPLCKWLFIFDFFDRLFCHPTCHFSNYIESNTFVVFFSQGNTSSYKLLKGEKRKICSCLGQEQRRGKKRREDDWYSNSSECTDGIFLHRLRLLLFSLTKGKSINLLLEVNCQTNLPHRSLGFFFQFRLTRETNLAVGDLSNVMSFKHVDSFVIWKWEKKKKVER